MSKDTENTKSLETLVDDIYSLFNPEYDHEVSEENLELFAENLKQTLRSKLRVREQSQAGALRFSALGKKDRQIWMDAHPDPDKEEKLLPKTYLKFLYGDILEELLLFLTREAGHEVKDEQREIEVGGVKGHIDAIIDGTVVDVKSASSFGYKKFAANDVASDDPFGYVEQLAGYSSVLTPNEPAAWLAFDKVHGDICVADLSPMIIKHHLPEPRINHLKKVVENDTPPELCYEPVPDGKSGNYKLPTPCGYCRHKFRCHPDVRVFLYSTGPKFLTTVAREPNVPEITT